MKVIVDIRIPYLKGLIETVADEVVYCEGTDFTPTLVHDADALIVRTRTRCDRALLKGSRVRFIATATIGYDHIDTAYCREAGITWTNAPGCNAGGVAQYVQHALLLLAQHRGLALQGACLGVVGVGHVGSRVAEVGRRLGMEVLLCDPPRAEREGSAGWDTLSTLAERCDIITLHTPLVREGAHPTFHLADEAFFRSLRRRPFFINTSRGETTDTAALLSALHEQQIADAVIDVWEHEPSIDRTLLERVFIGTPHIAGYSADGKTNASRMALTALCHHFRLPTDFCITPPAPAEPVLTAPTEAEARLLAYNPLADSRALKATPERFEQLRGEYFYRREDEAYTFTIQA